MVTVICAHSWVPSDHHGLPCAGAVEVHSEAQTLKGPWLLTGSVQVRMSPIRRRGLSCKTMPTSRVFHQMLAGNPCDLCLFSSG